MMFLNGGTWTYYSYFSLQNHVEKYSTYLYACVTEYNTKDETEDLQLTSHVGFRGLDGNGLDELAPVDFGLRLFATFVLVLRIFENFLINEQHHLRSAS